MKIIQIIQKPQLRGAELFACQLSNHLVRQGNEVLIVCLFKGEALLPYHGEIIYLDRPVNLRLFDYVGWGKLNSIVKKFKPNIIQANAADTLKYAVSSKMLFGFKSPVVLRNANKVSDFINSRFKKELNRFYLSQVAYVISVSKECEKDFVDTFKFPKERIKTVEIGVEKVEPGAVPKDLIHLFKGNIVITHIGSFVPEKNHQGLLRGFSTIYQSHPTAQLLLIGKGHLEEEIKREVETLPYHKQIHFLGYRNDVLDILKNSDVFVLPSLIEGLPGVLLEAMFCKTPVVAYNVGGISEIVTAKTGNLIEKNDEKGFSRAVIEAINNPDTDKIENAHRMVNEKFLNDKIASRFYEAYVTVNKRSITQK